MATLQFGPSPPRTLLSTHYTLGSKSKAYSSYYTLPPVHKPSPRNPLSVSNVIRIFLDDLLSAPPLEYEQHQLSFLSRISKYSAQSQVDLAWVIKQYMDHLNHRLNSSNTVSYRNLINPKQYEYDDFFSFGTRFVDFIRQQLHHKPSLFPQHVTEHYLNLAKQYNSKIPAGIVMLRSKMIDLLRPTSLEWITVGDDININYRMVSYQPVDHSILQSTILSIPSVDQQLDYFVKSIRLPEQTRSNLNNFMNCLTQAFESSCTGLFALRPRVYQFGSLASGLATYDSDMDIVVRFEGIPEDGNQNNGLGLVLDYETSIKVLKVLERIMIEKFKPRLAPDMIVPSKRCPIIKMQFEKCFPTFGNDIWSRGLDYSSCDISVGSLNGVLNSKLLHFLTQYDDRFPRMTLLLKYWAKTNGLIYNYGFSSYGFTLLVIFFLQTTRPPVLPSIGWLEQLALRQSESGHILQADFTEQLECVQLSSNRESVVQLLLQFFSFYQQFNFHANAICPRLGKVTSKKDLLKEKTHKSIDFHMSFLCIEDPLMPESNVSSGCYRLVTQKWMQLLTSVQNVITPENCVTLLSGPPLDISNTFDVQNYQGLFKSPKNRNRNGRRRCGLIDNQPVQVAVKRSLAEVQDDDDDVVFLEEVIKKPVQTN